MNLLSFVKNELDIMEAKCSSEEELKMQKQIDEDILNVIQKFYEQGHTGYTAGYVLGILERLLRFKPITPLTGEADEWEDCSQFGFEDKQNKRCPSVFKRPDGTAYWVEGKIFTDDNGETWYTSKESHIDITFPFAVPLHSETVYVSKDNNEEGVEKVKS